MAYVFKYCSIDYLVIHSIQQFLIGALIDWLPLSCPLSLDTGVLSPPLGIALVSFLGDNTSGSQKAGFDTEKTY